MAVAITAVATAIEVGTLAAALTAVASVGTVMTVVGVVTHSKELTKIGGTLALVGGIGSLANSAITSLGSAAAEGVAGAAEGAASDAFSDVAGEQFAQSVGQDAAGSGLGVASTSPIDLGSTVADKGSGIINSQMGAAPAGPVATPPTTGTSGIPGLSQDASGMIQTPDLKSPFDNNLGLPSGGATDKLLGPAELPDIGITGMTQTDQSMATQLKSKLGSAWDKLSPLAQAEMVKSALAVPGGIQAQKNMEAQLDIARQKTAQTSYGSQVPSFGIINTARKG